MYKSEMEVKSNIYPCVWTRCENNNIMFDSHGNQVFPL